MSAIGIIPARYASTRFPGKALAPLGGYPMVHHVYAAASQAASLSEVLIATDSTRVASALARIGDRVVLTAAAHLTGTDRVAEAARQFESDLVLNIQGDEPQLTPQIIDQLVTFMDAHPQYRMGTIASDRLSGTDHARINVAKVEVLDDKAVAFYRELPPDPPAGILMRHVGVYAFRRD
ncbi:MAG: NTP transferase domain-containing protein, partial [SAR324 cluster bacterium]|nr:NTP transferase domain-containing protein [SAR324 cluster bacterium]